MNTYNIVKISIIGIVALTSLIGCGKSSDETINNEKVKMTSDLSENENIYSLYKDIDESTYVMNDENVKMLGRTYLDNNNILWLGASGSGTDFIYTGQNLELTFICDEIVWEETADMYSRIAVYVNGERVLDEMLDDKVNTYKVFESEKEEQVEIKVIKLSEQSKSCCGMCPIKLSEGEKISPIEEKERKIEFIGDSITCGYGIDDEDKDHDFETCTEDITKTYAYKTAENLNADYSMICYSGYGIISGYTSTGECYSDEVVSLYYDNLGFSYGSFGGIKSYTLDWDFEKFRPDVIVINLVANDASYTGSNNKRCEEFVNEYIEFVKKIRNSNPEARIYFTAGISNTYLDEYVWVAYNRYKNETNDENVSAYKYESMNVMTEGAAASWHPTEKTNIKASEGLTMKIKEDMGW